MHGGGGVSRREGAVGVRGGKEHGWDRYGYIAAAAHGSENARQGGRVSEPSALNVHTRLQCAGCLSSTPQGKRGRVEGGEGRGGLVKKSQGQRHPGC